MSEIFNFGRFGKYLMTDLMNAWSKYGVILLTASFLNVIGYLLLRLSFGWDYYLSSMVIFILAGIFLVASISSFLYGHITDNRAGSNFLLLPASLLEKFLSMVLICAIIAPAIYLAVYLGTDLLFAAVDTSYQSIIPLIESLTGGPYWFVMLLISGIQVCTIFLLGALYFNKHKMIYTFLVLSGILIVLGIIDLATSDSIGNIINYVYPDNGWAFLIWFILWQILIFATIYFKLKKIQH